MCMAQAGVASLHGAFNSKILSFELANPLIICVNFTFCWSSVKYDLNCAMQALVVGCAVFLIHSTTIASVSSPTGALCFRFLAFGTPPGEVGEVGEVASSVALRFFCGPAATGLPARLPLGMGLVARLPSARGLPLRTPFVRIFMGAFGLVARFATTECPPRGAAAAGAGSTGMGVSVFTGSSTGGGGGGGGSSSSSSDDSSCSKSAFSQGH